MEIDSNFQLRLEVLKIAGSDLGFDILAMEEVFKWVCSGFIRNHQLDDCGDDDYVLPSISPWAPSSDAPNNVKSAMVSPGPDAYFMGADGRLRNHTCAVIDDSMVRYYAEVNF